MNEALWILGRGLGVSSLVLLTISVVAGVITVRRSTPLRTPRFAVAEIHRRASLLASGLVVGHVISLWMDTEAQLRLVDLVVPFLSGANPLWWGLGTLAIDLFLAVVVTSLLRKRIPHRVWRGIHLLSYLAWPLAVLHSFGSGTDAASGWFIAVALGCVGAVAGAITLRLFGTGASGRRSADRRLPATTLV